jgi:hypothetical protein
MIALVGVPEIPENRTKTDRRDRCRFSARHKFETVLRLLRGEGLDALHRGQRGVAANLSSWRAAFLGGGTAALKSHLAGDRDELLARLQAEVRQPRVDNELLGQRCQHLEGGRPFVMSRRSDKPAPPASAPASDTACSGSAASSTWPARPQTPPRRRMAVDRVIADQRDQPVRQQAVDEVKGRDAGQLQDGQGAWHSSRR